MLIDPMPIDPKNLFPRLHVCIDLGALRRNARLIRQHVIDTRILYTLKKDAYGHGALQCARVLEQEKADYFAVYLVHEAIELRSNGISTPILVFAVPQSVDEARVAIEHDLTLTAAVPRDLAVILEAARQVNKTARVHLKVDTGMGRVGNPAEAQTDMIGMLGDAQGVYLEGVYSHLADSEENGPMTARQLERFSSLVDSFPERPGLCHLANSGGALRPACRLDMVRIGIALYGGTPLYESEPVMAAYSHLAQTRWFEPGETISYGATYRVATRMRAGVVPGGYGDGIIRSLSSAGSVMIRGKEAPILGRVCMDQVIVDLSNIPDATEGDRALFFGSIDGVTFPAWKNAEAGKSISYELTTLVGRLAVQREWVEES